MTTLRIEVGRACSTTIEDVVLGLHRAGCMKDIELYTDSHAFLPIDELRVALRRAGFYVDDVTEPPPPPLPWWRYVQAWPRRVYYWGRRVVLRESTADQFLRVLYPPERVEAIERFIMRESPIQAREEPAAPWHPICWKCGARFPNGPGQYTARCPECGERWDGSEAV